MVRKIIKYFVQTVAFWTLSLAFSACGGVRSAKVFEAHSRSNCNQQNTYAYHKSDIPLQFHELDIDEGLKSRFSKKSLNVAHAIGIVDLLDQYLQLKRHENTADDGIMLRKLALAQTIYQRINIASLEVSAVASEIDCEEERASQVADYLKKIEDDRETRLTVSAIIIGATGAVSAGLLFKNSNVGEWIAIGTGIAEASFGLMILMNKKKVVFDHTRNALRDIWEDSCTSRIFPAPIWYYLNYYDPERPKERSLRYQIVESWMSFEQIAGLNTNKRKKILQLYFGDGGQYTAGQLNNRSNMLDQLESAVNLMKQDLKGLAVELEDLKL